MNKIMRLGILGILMSVCMLFFAGCGMSDKFEGKWATDIKNEKTDPMVYFLEIKKNGDKDYYIKRYFVHFSENKNDIVEGGILDVTAQKGGSENSINVQQGYQQVIVYNEEKKCLQFDTLGTGLYDYKLVKDDKGYQDIKDAVKKSYEENKSKKK